MPVQSRTASPFLTGRVIVTVKARVAGLAMKFPIGLNVFRDGAEALEPHLSLDAESAPAMAPTQTRSAIWASTPRQRPRAPILPAGIETEIVHDRDGLSRSRTTGRCQKAQPQMKRRIMRANPFRPPTHSAAASSATSSAGASASASAAAAASAASAALAAFSSARSTAFLPGWAFSGLLRSDFSFANASGFEEADDAVGGLGALVEPVLHALHVHFHALLAESFGSSGL